MIVPGIAPHPIDLFRSHPTSSKPFGMLVAIQSASHISLSTESKRIADGFRSIVRFRAILST